MRIIILGGDGYLGWPTAMHFAKLNHEVIVVDNYARRTIADSTESSALFKNGMLPERCQLYEELTGKRITYEIGDLSDSEFTFRLFEKYTPDTVVHYAEQPSAPYSMQNFEAAQYTLQNNLGVTFNVLWGMLRHCPDAHLIKLGTMGEYGTPNVDIPEGWFDLEYKGRKDKALFPRAAGSLYHTTKVLDTDLIWFYVRTYNLRVTDLMQGPVYGIETDETILHDGLLPNFHYDDIFGTLVNRFLVQAVAGVPLTVYGAGGQTRGYLNLKDTLKCIELAALNPATHGELLIYNQFTEAFSVNEVADRVIEAANELDLSATKSTIDNPRKEKEDHYYNPEHTSLIKLGLVPNFMTKEVLKAMLNKIKYYNENIVLDRITPRVKWK